MRSRWGRGAYLLVVLIAASACNDRERTPREPRPSSGPMRPASAGATGGDAACEDELEALLAKAGITEMPATDCGTFNGAQTAEVERAKACFEREVRAGRSAVFAVNNCIDCQILSTFASAPDGGIVHVFHEADHFGGDRVQQVRVERCESLLASSSGMLVCSSPVEVFACTGAF